MEASQHREPVPRAEYCKHLKAAMDRNPQLSLQEIATKIDKTVDFVLQCLKEASSDS